MQTVVMLAAQLDHGAIKEARPDKSHFLYIMLTARCTVYLGKGQTTKVSVMLRTVRLRTEKAGPTMCSRSFK